MGFDGPETDCPRCGWSNFRARSRCPNCGRTLSTPAKPADERSDRGSPAEPAPLVPGWCYQGGPDLCSCGHHEGYHTPDGRCSAEGSCGCSGFTAVPAQPAVVAPLPRQAWRRDGRARLGRALLKAIILVLSVTLGVLAASRWVEAEPTTKPPQTVPVRQVWIIDGDTLDVLEPVKDRIRLEGIDAPETWKPHCEAEKAKGLEAKRAAIRLLRAGREATIVRHGHDRYDRTLGTVAIDGIDLGESLIKLGLALPYQPGREAKAARIAHWCGPGEW